MATRYPFVGMVMPGFTVYLGAEINHCSVHLVDSHQLLKRTNVSFTGNLTT